MPESVTLLEFAERIGVTEGVVRKAIRTGRLERCLRRENGHQVIADAELAELEWERNADPAKGVGNGKVAAGTIAEARRRKILAEARREELKADVLAGRLLDQAEVRAMVSAMILRARTAMLGIPTRAKQRLPHLTAADLAILDELIRAALEELATDADDVSGDAPDA